MTLAGSAGCLVSCRKNPNQTTPTTDARRADYSNEEYVWISPHANLPLYKAHDHPALELAAKELGVKVTTSSAEPVAGIGFGKLS